MVRKHLSQLLPLFLFLFLASAFLSAQVLLGDQNIESTLDSNAAGRAQAFATTAGSNGVLNSLSLYVDSTSTASQVALGLYNDSSGHPSLLLTQGVFTPQAGVWNTVSVPPVAVVSGTPYWIAVLGLGSGRPYFHDTMTGCTSEGSSSGALAALPVVWSTGGIWTACALSAYGSTSDSSGATVSVTVAPVLVSLPAGGTQQFTATVTGTSNSAVTWSATGGSVSASGLYTASSTAGAYTVTATSVADTTESGSATVNVGTPGILTASLWPSNTVPGTVDSGDGSAVELGVQFTSSTAGAITGVKFYKSANNTGTHVGNLWTSSGTLLASATFTNETASGWQTVTFAQPVAIQANTTYVASYYTGAGHYSDDSGYFATAYSAPPLQALASGGVYVYSSNSAFPTQGWNASNYWVDVILQYAVAPTTVAVAITPTSALLTAGGTQQFTATLTGTSNTAVTWSASGGSISSGGLYTAPASAGTYTVTATSAADITESASATVTVSAPVVAVAVSLSPASVSININGTQQFTATVTGTSNAAVTWSASGGSISPSGLFTAPAIVGIYTVIATSVADPTKSASATAIVIAPLTHAVTLTWTASTSTVVGYNVYRSGQSGGPYTMINTAPQPGTTYADLSVQAGQTYYYVVTAVDSSGTESVYSDEVTAVVPSP
ncbi:MAG: DUF4082 domain-containing protein [Terriglobales bacterium]